MSRTCPRLLKMGERGGEISRRKAWPTQRRDEQRWVGLLLGETQELKAQISGSVERVLAVIEVPQSKRCSKQMRAYRPAVSQLQRTVIRGSRLGRSVALCGAKWFAKSDL